jgi:membrane-associated progesterone receptor component
MKPDHTPHPSRKTTGDDILFPGNPAMITSLDQLKPFTLEELAKYSGKEGSPIYISIGGKVFDCSAGVGFYGPGGAYELFAGRDISLAAAKFSKEEKYLDSPDLTNITPAEKDSFFHFYNMLYGKYPMIGTLLGSTYSEQLSQQKARQAKIVPPYAHLSKS